MRHIITLAINLLFVGFFSSCATQGFVSNVTRTDIQQIAQFEIFSDVGFIEKGNKIVFDDSLSLVAQTLFETALTKEKILPVTNIIVMEDSAIHNQVQYEISALMNCLESNMRPKNLPVPPTIDSILYARNERFGMLVYDWGFVRTSGNYGKQALKSIAIGILTLGMVIPIYYKEVTRTGILIYDAKNHNFAYVANVAGESSPLKESTYQRHVQGLLWRYYKKQ
jgi:hypothetical protein